MAIKPETKYENPCVFDFMQPHAMSVSWHAASGKKSLSVISITLQVLHKNKKRAGLGFSKFEKFVCFFILNDQECSRLMIG